MKCSRLAIGMVVGVLLICPAMVRGETAEQAFNRGNTLLATGDFQEALQTYATAVQADRANQEYAQQFMLVRRVIALQQSLDREKDPRRWQQTAQSLRSFYVDQGIYAEALSVDEQVHAKLNTASSAMQLAETQLAMGKAADAVRVLASLDSQKATIATQALLGISLARQGQVPEAKKVSQTVALPDTGDPGTLYSVARMHAAVGNHDKALDMLARTFQTVPPSQLDNLKTHAKQSPEFAGLASTDDFAKVLETKSEIAESRCSGGSSCAGCPMRGNCPSSGGG